MPPVRLATWNILNGTSLQDGRVDAGRLREAAAGLRADVLGLQEVDRGQPRSHGLDLTREVAQGCGAAHWRFVPALLGTPGGQWRAALDGGGDGDGDGDGRGDEAAGDASGAAAGDASGAAAYGVGLVSLHPVRAWHVLRMPAARVRSPILLPGTRQVLWLQDEPRVAVAAVLDSPLGTLTVATTHLSFMPGWNVLQLRRLVGWLRRLPGPYVLLGDLNMPAVVARAVSGWSVLGRRPTYPSTGPRVQLDHVLGRGSLPPVTHVDTPVLPVSDHRPLVVQLRC